MAVNYTDGAYTVKSQYNDSSADIAITRAVPDINWRSDFAVVSENESACKLVNTTGSALETCESVSIRRQDIANMYTRLSLPVDAAARLADKRGVHVDIQIEDLYAATNAQTGEKYMIPVRAWLAVETSIAPIVTKDIVEDIVGRLNGCESQWRNAAASGITEVATVVSAMRGDLVPFRAQEA
jgi:hypothetical protein